MSECHCIIRHARTDAERREVGKALQYARSVGDSAGTMLALAQLGPCKADPVEDPGAHAARVAKYAPERARLDADGKAKPRTRIIGKGRRGDCQGPGITRPAALEDTTTGKRTPLAPKR